MRLFGKEYTRKSFYQHFGDVSQVGGVKSYTLNDGKARGVRALEVNTGAGLRFTVLPDRCMDIGWADFKGTPLCFISKAGMAGSTYFEHKGEELHRVFFGGLLTTCGLRNVGLPCVVDGEEFAQHGRISNTPAENVGIFADWEGDEYKIVLRGVMREATLHGENLQLVRTIETKLGDTSFRLTDTVRNLAFRDEEICMLYHCNFGHPLVDEGARIVTPDANVLNEPLDWRPARWTQAEGLLHAPGQKSRGGYRLDFDVKDVKVGIVNPNLEGFKGIYLKYSKDQLNCHNIWHNLVQGDYVVGLEPGTVYTDGRKKLKEGGKLITLKPMEEKTNVLEFGIEL